LTSHDNLLSIAKDAESIVFAPAKIKPLRF
jgi:hypothetical protein